MCSTPSGALNNPVPQAATSEQHHSNVGAIVGAVVGVLVLAGLALILFLICRRRAQRRRTREDDERRAAGLGPAPPRMRGIRGNTVLQPFVDDRPPDAPAGTVYTGNVFARGPYATASSAGAGPSGSAGTGVGASNSRAAASAFGAATTTGAFEAGAATGTFVAGAGLDTVGAGTSAAALGPGAALDLPPAFVDTAATAGRYPLDSKTRTLSLILSLAPRLMML